jgi:hypothetical protein
VRPLSVAGRSVEGNVHGKAARKDLIVEDWFDTEVHDGTERFEAKRPSARRFP